MVHKTCPDCTGTLPVASKQCPCGYVFSAKKMPTKTSEKKIEVVSSRLRPERAKKNYALHRSYIIHSLSKRQSSKGEDDENYESDDPELADFHGSPYEDDDSPTYNPEGGKGNGRARRELRNGHQHKIPSKEKDHHGPRDSPSFGKLSECFENGDKDDDVPCISPHGNPPDDGGDGQNLVPRRPRGRPKGSKDKKPRQPKGYREMNVPSLARGMGHCSDKPIRTP